MAPPFSSYDAVQCVRGAFDELTGRFRTDATAVVVGGDITVEVDGIFSLLNPDPDNIGLIGHTRAVTPGDADQTNRITSITNIDVHALDVALHNSDGSAIDASSPLFVSAIDFDIRDLLHTQDSVRLGDGTNFLTSTTVGPDVGLDVFILNTLTVSGTVDVSNFPTTVDTNYGVVGASTIRTAAQIGNSTGTADFNAGTTTAQTLRVVLPTDQSAIPISDISGLVSSTASLTQVARTNASTTLLASNSSRKGAILYNDASAVCYVTFGATSTTSAFSFRMTNNESVFIDKSPIYTGVISGIWASNGAGNMNITELT